MKRFRLMKICKQCQKDLPNSDFYLHPLGENGLQPKCKSCCRANAVARISKKSATDPSWVIQERERQRQKSIKNRQVKSSMILAHQAVKRAIADKTLAPQPCEVCQSPKTEAHHDSYLPQDQLNVRWLCRHHHNLHHMAERATKKYLGRPRSPNPDVQKVIDDLCA